MSPFLAGLAVSIGVPILLCYVYGVVPIALCRSEGMPEKRIKISKILILVGKNLLKDCVKTVLDQTYILDSPYGEVKTSMPTAFAGQNGF